MKSFTCNVCLISLIALVSVKISFGMDLSKTNKSYIVKRQERAAALVRQLKNLGKRYSEHEVIVPEEQLTASKPLKVDPKRLVAFNNEAQAYFPSTREERESGSFFSAEQCSELLEYLFWLGNPPELREFWRKLDQEARLNLALKKYEFTEFAEADAETGEVIYQNYLVNNFLNQNTDFEREYYSSIAVMHFLGRKIAGASETALATYEAGRGGLDATQEFNKGLDLLTDGSDPRRVLRILSEVLGEKEISKEREDIIRLFINNSLALFESPIEVEEILRKWLRESAKKREQQGETGKQEIEQEGEETQAEEGLQKEIAFETPVDEGQTAKSIEPCAVTEPVIPQISGLQAVLAYCEPSGKQRPLPPLPASGKVLITHDVLVPVEIRSSGSSQSSHIHISQILNMFGKPIALAQELQNTPSLPISGEVLVPQSFAIPVVIGDSAFNFLSISEILEPGRDY